MQRNKCITELVLRTRVDGPLLRERVGPILAVPEPLKRLNVLDYSKLLVVSLFDQEAVVLDGTSIFQIWLFFLVCVHTAFVPFNVLRAIEFALFAIAAAIACRFSSLRPARRNHHES